MIDANGAMRDLQAVRPGAGLAWLPIGLLAIIAVWLIASPMLGGWFGPIDDFELAAILGPSRHLELADVVPTVQTWIAGDVDRVRPLRWVFRILEAYAWGWNPAGLYLDRVLLALVTVIATGVLVGRYVARPIAALAAVLVIVGLQSEIWYRLGPQETYAVPLFMVGLALIAYGHARVGLLLVVLRRPDEGDFIPMAALAAVWAWTLGYRWPALVAGVATGLIALAVAYVLATHGEPFGQVRDTTSVRLELEWMLASAAAVTAWPVAVVILLLLERRRAALVILVAGVIVVPQAILDADMRAGRYMLPAALGAVLVTVAALAALHRRWRRAGLVATYAIALLTVPAILGQAQLASRAPLTRAPSRPARRARGRSGGPSGCGPRRPAGRPLGFRGDRRADAVRADV